MLKTSGPWRACPFIVAVQTSGNLSLGEPRRLEQHWDFEGHADQVLRKSGNNPYPGQPPACFVLSQLWVSLGSGKSNFILVATLFSKGRKPAMTGSRLRNQPVGIVAV